MNDHQMNGIMYYCFNNHSGCLIIGSKIPKDIDSACANDKDCQWEDVGTFTIKENKLLLYGPTNSYYQNLNSNWSNARYRSKIFNQNMEKIYL